MSDETHIHIHCCGDQTLADRVSALEELVMTLTDNVNAIKAEFISFIEDVTALQGQVGAIQAQLDAADIPGATAALADLKTDLDAAVASVGDVNQDGTPPATP